MGVHSNVSCCIQLVQQLIQKPWMPMHLWAGSGVSEHLECTSGNIALGNSLTDAKVACVGHSPSVEIFPCCRAGVVVAGTVDFLAQYGFVPFPLLDKAVFEFFQLASYHQTFACPSRTLFECTVIVDYSVLNSLFR